MSPEIVSKREYFGGPSDIWACGVLLYSLICGTYPFKSSFEKDLYKKIQRGHFSFPSFVSEGVKDLINKILVVEPSRRLTADQILKHEWLGGKGDLF